MLLTAAAAACSEAKSPQRMQRVVAQDLIANLPQYDGRSVIVQGWIGTCEPESCQLFASRSDIASNNADAISVGPSLALDRALSGRGATEIVIEGQVNALCDRAPEGSVTFCVDRVDELRPLSFRIIGSR